MAHPRHALHVGGGPLKEFTFPDSRPLVSGDYFTPRCGALYESATSIASDKAIPQFGSAQGKRNHALGLDSDAHRHRINIRENGLRCIRTSFWGKGRTAHAKEKREVRFRGHRRFCFVGAVSSPVSSGIRREHHCYTSFDWPGNAEYFSKEVTRLNSHIHMRPTLYAYSSAISSLRQSARKVPSVTHFIPNPLQIDEAVHALKKKGFVLISRGKVSLFMRISKVDYEKVVGTKLSSVQLDPKQGYAFHPFYFLPRVRCQDNSVLNIAGCAPGERESRRLRRRSTWGQVWSMFLLPGSRHKRNAKIRQKSVLTD